MDGLFSIDLDDEPSTRLLRGLKGGSGGGSGGGGGGSRGGSSGGSSYGGGRGNSYGSNSSNNNGNPFPIPIWAIIICIVSSVLGLLLLCFCFCPKNKEGVSATTGSDDGFDQAVSSAREKQTANSTFNTFANDAAPNFETYAGDFDIKYEDRGKKLSGFAKIQLKNNGNGYKIEGDCSDADGAAAITEGFVSFTGDTWWVEETFSGRDKGLKVLNLGTLDFSTNTFSGTWRANNGVRGRYTDFKGKNVSKTFRSGGAIASNPPTLDAMLEEDIPMVFATVETPVVQAVPEIASAAPFVPGEYPAYNQANGPGNYSPRV